MSQSLEFQRCEIVHAWFDGFWYRFCWHALDLSLAWHIENKA